MALFSLGHDCAHASFTSYPLFNDTIGNLFASVALACSLSCQGTFLFTWILIPYYPWKVNGRASVCPYSIAVL